jgi:adenylate cyclase
MPIMAILMSAQIPPLSYWIVMFIILFLIIILAYFYLEWKTWSLLKVEKYLDNVIQRRTDSLVKEKTQIEGLLINMLPKDTAEELKATNRVKPKRYDLSTILFADIQGFTKISKDFSPEDLIEILDRIFFNFDKIVEKYNIEKIKTIGDCYMCAGGVPKKNSTNPIEVVLAALEMQQFMKELNTKYSINWKLRIGVHSGSIIAGVVGSKKLTYDIWGDSVNTASRMETHGAPDRVNISGITYELTKEYFDCEYREKVPIKNMGAVEMFFVKGIKPEFIDENLSEPNREFKLRIQQLRMKDLEEEIINKLIVDIPSSMTFNNLQHTLDVQRYTEAIAKYENVTNEEMLLLKTAAILHDIGYIWDYDSHTKLSVDFAIQILKKYSYTDNQIKQVSELINATSKPYRPSSKMEKILCDADQSYLLKKNVDEYIENKYKQVKANSKIRSEKTWYKEELEKIRNPKFYTTAIHNFNELSQEERQRIFEKMTAGSR